MKVRMLTNLFHNSRMNGVIIPDAGEVVDLSDADAEALMKPIFGKPHAEPADAEVEVETAVDPEPMSTADLNVPETATEAPAEKRGPGRPRKS